MIVLANIAGWIFSHRRLLLAGVAGVVLIIAVVVVYRACNKPPKLNHDEIIKAQKAIAEQDRKEMIEVLTESTVREQAIESNIKQAEEATDKAKRDYSALSNDELAKELERRLNEGN